MPIYTSLPPDQARYILDDAGVKIVVCSDLEMWRKVAAVRDALPGPRARHPRRGRPSGRHRRPVGRRGHGPAPRPGGARTFREFGRGRQARGPGLHHLHLRHDRRPQGRHAQPRQLHRATSLAAGRGHRFRCADGRRPVLPAPVPRLRADGRRYFLFHVGATIAYAESVETVAGEHASRSGRPSCVSVPRLFEKIYARIMDRSWPASRRQAGHLPSGPSATGKKYAARTIAGDRAAGPSGLKHAPRPTGSSSPRSRPGPAAGSGYFICGGAPLVRGDRRVLRRHRHAHPARATG
ncbi:MAG: hypothetical protein MZV63_63030 [Marinilabiliales bacterium]|nr:hypothetical protein [Marinilabiliales bacterium]